MCYIVNRANHNTLYSEVPWRSEKDLKTLVENRVIFGFENCELNIFETHEEAEDVHLSFDNFVITSMIKGKKNISLGARPYFDYLPGEIVIAPPGELMKINFPEAGPDTPTQCIALSISEDTIRETFEFLNDKHPRLMSNLNWDLDHSFFHLLSRKDLKKIVGRFIQLAITDETREKDAIAALTLREMLIRLSQTQARTILQSTYLSMKNETPLAHVVDYIKSNITEQFKLEELSKKACMSPSHFSRSFKKETGLSVTEFVQLERLKIAKKLLMTSRLNVREVAYHSGFTDINFFNRVFKRELGATPGKFRNSQASQGS